MAGPTLNLLDLPNEVLDYILSLLHPSSSLFECGQTCGRLALAVERVLAHMAVELPKSVKDQSLIWRSERTLETRSTHIPQGCEISKRYSHSACYDDNSYSMYVFGGCTSTSTTFNDLWKLDLKTRTWQRPLSTGTYPSPKACSTMVLSQGQLYLFGGWTHPSLYPLHQSWRLFNELHCYDIEQNRWSHLTPVGVAKPPSMAGHSATVHEDIIVVFGGLQKQRNHIGQFCSSNDVWCFNITTFTWYQPDIPSPKPNPRYGQSQLWLDDKHLLILGGCGGPNNLYDDVWVLSMEQPHWKWISIAVKNQDQAPHHLWCHPACKVDGYAIILGKRRLSAKPTATPHKQELEKDHQWNMIPSARHGVNRGYSSIRVVRRSPNGNNNNSNNQPEAASSRPSSELASNSDSEMDTSGDLSVEPTNGAIGDEPPTSTFKSSVTLEIQQNAEDAQPSTSRGLPDLDGKSGPLEPKEVRPSSLERQSSVPENLGARPKIVNLESDHRRKSSLSQLPPSQLARLQAFSSGSPGTYNITSCSAGSGTNSSSPKTKQQETRQRQLDAIKRMEDRIKKLGSQEEPKVNPEPVTSTPTKCVCHRLSAHVLDLGQAVTDHEVKWLEIRGFLGRDSPEETILYSLVKARSELILFGGIQKDISSMASRSQPASSSDTVSNSLFYLVPPTTIELRLTHLTTSVTLTTIMSRPPPKEHEGNPPTLSIASILASGASNVMASTLMAPEEEHSTTVQLAAAVSSTMASTLTLADARDTALPDPFGGSSNTSPIEPDRPVLEISGLQETLRDIELSNHFRDFLRSVDRNTSAPPEVKGRFERYFDFHIQVLELLDVPQDDLNRRNKLMIELHQDFFSSPSQTISISSQGALRKLKEHLKELKQIIDPNNVPNLELIHPVHEEVYAKLNSKHGQWKMNYKPTTSLNTLMCMLS